MELQNIFNMMYKENDIINFLIYHKEEKYPKNLYLEFSNNFVEKSKEILKPYLDSHNISYSVQPLLEKKKANDEDLNSNRRVALYLDFDNKDYDNLRVQQKELASTYKRLGISPNFTVFTGHGYHDYFLIENMEVKEWNIVEKALIKITNSDKQIGSLIKVLRYPLSYNTKDRANPIEVLHLYKHDKKYKFNDFSKVIAEYDKIIKKEDIKLKKELKEEARQSKIRAELGGYKNEYKNTDLNKLIIKTLSTIDTVPYDYKSFLDLCFAFKSAGYQYEQIDCVFADKKGYNQANNKKIYDKIKADNKKSKKITMATAYYYCKEYAFDVFVDGLKKIAKTRKEKSIPTFLEKKGFFLYSALKDKYGQITEKKATNFTCKILKQIRNDDNETVYELELRNSKEKMIRKVNGEIIINLSDFSKFLGKQGHFLIYIKDKDIFMELIDYIFKGSNIIEAKSTKFLGKAGKDVFLMNNAILTKNGKQEITNLIPPDTKKMVYRKTEDFDLKKFVLDMKYILKNQAWKMFGFIVASFFSSELVNKNSSFPILFILGKSGSGKNTIAEYIAACFGAHKIPFFNFGATAKSFQRTMALHYACPLTLNEYTGSTKHNSLVCSIYDREGYLQAQKTNGDFKTNEVPVNGTTMLVGTDDVVGFKARDVFMRLLELNSSDFTRDDKSFEIITECNKNKNNMIEFVEFALKNMDFKELFKIIEETRRYNAKSLKGKISDRIILNYSVIQASANYFYQKLNLPIDEKITLKDIFPDITKQDKDVKSVGVAESIKDIIISIIDKDVHNYFEDIFIIKDKDVLFKNKPALLTVLSEAKKAGVILPGISTIMSRLKEIGTIKKSVRVNGQPRKFYAIPISDEGDEEITKVENSNNEIDYMSNDSPAKRANNEAIKSMDKARSDIFDKFVADNSFISEALKSNTILDFKSVKSLCDLWIRENNLTPLNYFYFKKEMNRIGFNVQNIKE